jgi:F-type H+-transporting ATPase subunit b
MTFLSQLAAVMPTAEQGIFSILGIDWRLLIIQIIAFLILVALLGKFVYPWLMKSVDERQANIESAAKAADEAQKSAEANKDVVVELLLQAQKEAAEIVSTAKLESAEMVNMSEKKAQKMAERIVADAHDQLEKDIASARKVLYNDTLELVSMATEKIIHKKIDKKTDGDLIATAMKASE